MGVKYQLAVTLQVILEKSGFMFYHHQRFASPMQRNAKWHSDPCGDPSGKTCCYLLPNTLCRHHMAVIPSECQANGSLFIHTSRLPFDICFIHIIQIKSFLLELCHFHWIYLILSYIRSKHNGTNMKGQNKNSCVLSPRMETDSMFVVAPSWRPQVGR